MNEPERGNGGDANDNESLANVRPTPVVHERQSMVGNFALGAVTLTVAGAGVFLLIAGTMQPCMGATRSTRLEWEKRQREIEMAIEEQTDQTQVNSPR